MGVNNQPNDESRVNSAEPASRSGHAQWGMTLYELLIVLAILAMLAALIAPRVMGYMGRAKSDVASSQMSNIATALELYFFDVGQYPNQQDTLSVLVTKPADKLKWRGPYLKEESGLVDPWGTPFIYALENNGESFVVSSLGRDGVAGGEGEDRDLEKR